MMLKPKTMCLNALKKKYMIKMTTFSISSLCHKLNAQWNNYCRSEKILCIIMVDTFMKLNAQTLFTMKIISFK